MATNKPTNLRWAPYGAGLLRPTVDYCGVSHTIGGSLRNPQLLAEIAADTAIDYQIRLQAAEVLRSRLVHACARLAVARPDLAADGYIGLQLASADRLETAITAAYQPDESDDIFAVSGIDPLGNAAYCVANRIRDVFSTTTTTLAEV